MSSNKSRVGRSQIGTNSTRTVDQGQQFDDETAQSQENDPDNRENKAQLDRSTLRVVQELKEVLGEKSSTNRALTKAYIEEQVANIRGIQSDDDFSSKKWKKTLPSDAQNCSASLLRRARAYSDDPKQVAAIIANMTETDSTDATREDQDPAETSLNQVIEPIKRLKKEKCLTIPNLSRTVLDMDDNEIDRADRMFYAEARNLIEHSDDYTFENACDQVQAIRLMQYEIDHEEDLRCLIQQHRNFNDAYAFLQQLMKRRMKESPRGVKPSSSKGDDGGNSSKAQYPNVHKSVFSDEDRRRDNASSNGPEGSASSHSYGYSGSSTTRKSPGNQPLVNTGRNKDYNS